MRKLEGIEDLNDEKSLKPDISPLEVANLIFDGNNLMQFISLDSYFIWSICITVLFA